jgi:hypothetical protein
MSSRYKYVVKPGWVTSKNDGQQHYIGAMQLIRLYQVDPRLCYVYEPTPRWTRWDAEEAKRIMKDLIPLVPRYDGNYRVPTSPAPSGP